MKLLRYGPLGQENPGILDTDGNIRSLKGIVNDIDGDALSEENLQRIKALDISSLPIVDGDVRLGACVGSVGKFLCIGLNYADHAA